MKSECLYKYLDINGALSMILNKELQFTNPIYFNDPFDCHPGLFDFQVPDGYSRGWMPKSFIQKKAICDSTNERRRVWICSLSKRHDSMLMWSYYANHKGVCIGLNKDKHTEFLSKGSLGLLFIANQEVDYRNVLEKPNGVCGAPFMYQLCTKSSQWQHEQEIRHIILDPHPWIPHRMIRTTSKNDLIPWTEVRFYPKLSAECFDSIYLGARISEYDKLRILKAIYMSLPGIKVFQMVPDHQSFSFVEEPINVETYLAEHKESSWSELKSKIKNCFPFRIKVSIEWNRPRTVRRHFRM